jgi:hypothetical protein
MAEAQHRGPDLNQLDSGLECNCLQRLDAWRCKGNQMSPLNAPG